MVTYSLVRVEEHRFWLHGERGNVGGQLPVSSLARITGVEP